MYRTLSTLQYLIELGESERKTIMKQEGNIFDDIRKERQRERERERGRKRERERENEREKGEEK